MSDPTGRTTERPGASANRGSGISTIGGLIALVFIIAMLLTLFRSPRATALPTVLVVVACAFGLPWILTPIVVKKSQWMSVETRFEPFDPESEDVPPRARDAIMGIVPRLESVGFQPLGHFRLDGSSLNVTAYVSLLENRSARHTARILTTVVANSPIPIYASGVTTLVIISTFSDGTRLVTSNNVVQRLQPSLRTRTGTMSFPWIRDPFRLYAIHQACIARHAADGIRVAPTINAPLNYLRMSREEELADLVETGHFYLEEVEALYRLTWRGAILGAWKLLWPAKPIREILRRRAALRLLREVELDRPSDPAPAPAREGPYY